ncbi:ARMADILLO BTB ARABIDOPSIS PROTEIN 1-like [Venturia canescens]|uniref:ARMADILLO BTB ARABIDOPSIS PROTEIN 1-like n=1 Tax=Venturia canescens TaxID=32260 RepID=UPI001C9D4070|nr:ARMADILLO BTB ARABIDOPSIS PROTEIN 1-like [Venturia canescens]
MDSIEITFPELEQPVLFDTEEIFLDGQHLTRFEWILKDWTLLYDTYAKGVSSNFFQLRGLDECLCQITFSPKNQENFFVIEFSNTDNIQAMRIVSHMNGERLLDCCYLRPVPTTLRRLGIDVNEKSDLFDFLKVNSPNRDDKSLKFEVYFFITKILESRSPSCQISPSNTVSLRDMFESKTLGDVTFVFDDKQLLAHKSVLAARSEVFQAMFSGEMKEKDTSRVEIVDTKAEIFEEFLKYLYIGELNDFNNKIEDMLLLSVKYQVCELKEMCEEYMLKNVYETNAVQYLFIANKCHCAALKKKALNILENSSRALKQAIMCENAEALIILKEILAEEGSPNESET